MSVAFNLIFAAKAKSTHHKLALDALRHLQSPSAEKWRDAFLYYEVNYLQGAKAPDDEFKDFKNHVLHVSDNFWGGAVGAAKNWYGHFLTELRAQNWAEAAYCAGVLSHYYTDPLMPFHTGQSEAEGAVHRAAEWSITKSYEILRDILLDRLGGWPNVQLTSEGDWLKEAIHEGAKLAHPHYDFLIDHYNLDRGVKNPPEGLDEPSREILAQLLGYAAVSFARILDHAFAEAAATPPSVTLTPQALFSTLATPIGALAKKFTDQKERAQILAMYDEYVATGKCVITLPEDDRVVRAGYAKEVLKVPLSQLDAEKPRKPGQQFGQGAAPRIVEIAAKTPAPVQSVSEKVSSTLSKLIPPSRKQTSTFTKRPAIKPLAEEPASITASSPHADAQEEVAASASIEFLEPNTPEAPTAPPPLAPKRSARQAASQAASQFSAAMVPKVKQAASGVASLVGRLKPKPKLLAPAASATETTADPPKSKIVSTQASMLSSFMDRFKSKPASEPVADKTVWQKPTPAEPRVVRHGAAKEHSETLEFQPADKKAKPATTPTTTAAGKFYLQPKSSVEDGPSIGPKMAARMATVGVKTVEDLLRADATQLGAKLGFNAAASTKIKDWQDQARLVCRIPNLRGHDAQILVACNLRDPNALASANPASLTKQALAFAQSAEGQRLLRGASMPDAEEVKDWITWAKSARSLKAA